MPNGSTISITAREARAVADRLWARAIGRRGSDSRAQRRDLKLAAKLLRALLRDYADRALVELELGSGA